MKLVISKEKTINFDIIRIPKILPNQRFRSTFSNLGGYGGIQEIPWAGITEEVEIELIKKNIQVDDFYKEVREIEKALSSEKFTKATQPPLEMEVEVSKNNSLETIEFLVFPKRFSFVYKPKRGHIFVNGYIYHKKE